jgi:hypothetical protein
LADGVGKCKDRLGGGIDAVLEQDPIIDSAGKLFRKHWRIDSETSEFALA